MSAATEYFPQHITRLSRSSVVKFGAIGYGYWGPNVVRNLDGLEGAQVDIDFGQVRRARVAEQRRPYRERTSPRTRARLSARPKSTRLRSSLLSGRISSLPKQRSRTASMFSWRNRSPAMPRKPRS